VRASALLRAAGLVVAGLCLAGCGWFQRAPLVHPEVVTESGLVMQDLYPSPKQRPAEGEVVWIHYTAWVKDGAKIDSTHDGGEPVSFVLGEEELVPAAIHEGLSTMGLYGSRRLTAPSELAFGDEGVEGLVPPDATVVFEVELVGIGPEWPELQSDGPLDSKLDVESAEGAAGPDEPAPSAEEQG
jgi:hypothetical protein